MKSDVVAEIKEGVRNGTILPVDGIVKMHDGKTYRVSGEKRLTVVVVREKKEKVKKQVEARECTECGESFTPSKFNPYFTVCPACRFKERHAEPVEARKCEMCEKEFLPSKFNPYFVICPECRREEAKAKAKARRAEKAS